MFIDVLADLLSPLDAERGLLKAIVENVSGCFDACWHHMLACMCCVYVSITGVSTRMRHWLHRAGRRAGGTIGGAVA